MKPIRSAGSPGLAAAVAAVAVALVPAFAAVSAPPDPWSQAGSGTAPPPPAADSLATPPLTLGEAVARALETYPAVAAARSRREAAEHRLAETEASRLPRLRASGSAVQYQEPVPVTPIHGFGAGRFPEFDETIFQAALTVEYTVTDGGGRAARIRAGEAEAAAAGHSLEAAAQAVAARTAAVYLRALALERTLAAHDRRLAALDAERDRTVLRLEAGRAAEVELRRLDAALAAAAADRVAVETELATARADLGRLTGDPPGSAAVEIPLAPVRLVSPEPPRDAELFERARAASPEIARAEERLRAAEAAVALAESARRPRLVASGNLLGFAGADVSVADEWNAGLQVAVPLWAAGAERERIAAAEAERQAAAESLRLAELDTAEALGQAAAAGRRARARAESLERAVAANAEVVRVEALRLEAGAGVTADYLAAEADLLASEALLTEARQSEIVARIELARLTGELGEGWIAAELAAAPGADSGSDPDSDSDSEFDSEEPLP